MPGVFQHSSSADQSAGCFLVTCSLIGWRDESATGWNALDDTLKSRSWSMLGSLARLYIRFFFWLISYKWKNVTFKVELTRCSAGWLAGGCAGNKQTTWHMWTLYKHVIEDIKSPCSCVLTGQILFWPAPWLTGSWGSTDFFPPLKLSKHVSAYL